ncbi:MAG: preprotein translocase subunit SecE [Thermomicrobiales bacterium]|nr:preprotein translocase subunit SecE [Thermomicrobiales bacterium]MEA2586453.1 preprotein translocase subunit SecE [Thermomicrobiales bacterium]
MSAQRRTGSKSQSGAATVASRPTAPPAAAPSSQRAPKPTGERSKAASPGQPSVFAARTEAIRRLFRDTMSEAKKVNWPDRETTRNLTVVVIGISVILGLLLGGIDFALVKLLNVF